MAKKRKSLPALKKACQIVFNAYIRERDKDLPCISCGQFKPLQAGHFFSVRMYDGLRFYEHNCHGECAGCNCFNDSHLIFYAQNLNDRIGLDKVNNLHLKAGLYKRNGYKFSRSEIEDKITEYKQKIKTI